MGVQVASGNTRMWPKTGKRRKTHGPSRDGGHGCGAKRANANARGVAPQRQLLDAGRSGYWNVNVNSGNGGVNNVNVNDSGNTNNAVCVQ